MTPEVRAKIRATKLNSGKGKTYSKLYGRRTHRVIAELILGRPLSKGEVVHHIDGNVRNNDPANLQVFSSLGEHTAWHNRDRARQRREQRAMEASLQAAAESNVAKAIEPSVQP
jgi:hypothetical protein